MLSRALQTSEMEKKCYYSDFLQPPWEGSPSRTISRKIKCDEEPREMLLISLVDMVETWGELG